MRKLRFGFFAVLGGLALLLGGPGDCGGLDARRAAICRQSVSAVVEPDAAVEILRVGRGAAPASMRVDYRLGDQGTAHRARWIVCGFGSGDDLVSVTTEHGALSGAAVHLLKRYFLEAVETPAVPSR